MSNLRARLLTISAMVSVLALAAFPAFAQEMPRGTSPDGGTTPGDSLGDVFSSSVSDFTTLLMDLAPYLFGGLVTVLLIRLAIKWFQRVTRSV